MSNEGARDVLTTTKEGKENNAVDAQDAEAKTELSENSWPRKSSRARKKSEKLCSVDRCMNAAVNDGMCKRHGAEMTNKLCSAEGCTNYAVNKQGFCVRHGHGAKTPVRPPPPSYPPPGYLRFAERVQSGKNDTKSDQGEISAAGGTKRKRSSGEEEAPKKDGKKYKKKPKCSHDGCTNSSIKRGVCWRHGAKNLVNNRKRCSAEGCKNHVHKGEVCIHIGQNHCELSCLRQSHVAAFSNKDVIFNLAMVSELSNYLHGISFQPLPTSPMMIAIAPPMIPTMTIPLRMRTLPIRPKQRRRPLLLNHILRQPP
eukprot:scaffold16471_cov106-Skeletonema_dohrnii-CCMP3373.AAC.4